jgi:hypothetical protein
MTEAERAQRGGRRCGCDDIAELADMRLGLFRFLELGFDIVNLLEKVAILFSRDETFVEELGLFSEAFTADFRSGVFLSRCAEIWSSEVVNVSLRF